MSLLSWLFPSSRRAATPARAAPPAGAVPAQAPAVSAERMQRREQLYAVVRDVMVRVGVLSAGYKFKVLSLDQRGAQFLVLVDTAPEYVGDPARGAEIEALIVQTAQVRCDILVTSVYWRVNPQLGRQPAARAAGAPLPAADGASPAAPSAEAAPPVPQAAPAPPLVAPAPAAPLVPPAQPVPLVAGRAPGRFEPIEDDEVEAFRQAVARAAATRPAPAAGPVRSGPLLPPAPGFEDTLMPGQEPRKDDLSATQYGDL
ncbi:hypothetical protein SAMN05428957_102443 [Oryzisolibacter propanilivorax]|uniref:Uncharacterized protein n=1 Tax=Oryzisolibacter propanilivorax TaxID=1527607 RepID=A0A1G9QN78_9BURK|nr:hypothetical protein [Oryzisolibacter propanilivorax]SDM12350.1 hypothetical protein SAMN05428957_102443 [Oryzisolibacter propanilivorax]